MPFNSEFVDFRYGRSSEYGIFQTLGLTYT